MGDPRLPVGSARCQCSGCLLYFKSPANFARHRREGRCLTAAELRARGMEPNAAGYWRVPLDGETKERLA